jgi:hypothetical protein
MLSAQVLSLDSAAVFDILVMLANPEAAKAQLQELKGAADEALKQQKIVADRLAEVQALEKAVVERTRRAVLLVEQAAAKRGQLDEILDARIEMANNLTDEANALTRHVARETQRISDEASQRVRDMAEALVRFKEEAALLLEQAQSAGQQLAGAEAALDAIRGKIGT